MGGKLSVLCDCGTASSSSISQPLDDEVKHHRPQGQNKITKLEREKTIVPHFHDLHDYVIKEQIDKKEKAKASQQIDWCHDST